MATTEHLEHPTDAVQLIDEAKQFSPAILPYFRHILHDGNDIGHEYHVISVFGSQSSGKSTLLNVLFNTQFDTMDAQVKRQQTTKGIWLSHTRTINNHRGDRDPVDRDIFVLDVEGSDGAERGEDQDFERKAALFAIAVSEILIVNLWEQQIGLYQGNNMALLKTVFEVNLSLFGNSHQKKKVLLLFVIRDHVGVTPLASLSESLITELESVWKDLNKPIGSENVSLYDFFDLEFVGLAHKVLQNDKFIDDVKLLGDSLSTNSSDSEENGFFKKIYQHSLPLDGWCMYAESCWDQIENNKDLDLPTQQILVARFKTNEILQESFQKYFNNFDENITPIINQKEKLITSLQNLKENCLNDYDETASRYAKQVYLENRQNLLIKINSNLEKAINLYLENLTNNLMGNLQNDIKSNSNSTGKKIPFIDMLNMSIKNVTLQFTESINEFKENDLIQDTNDNLENFKKIIDSKSNDLKKQELKLTLNRLKKLITYQIKDDTISLLSNPTTDVWDQILLKFESTINNNLKQYEKKIHTNTDHDHYDDKESRYDFQIGLTETENKNTYKKIRFMSWSILATTVHDYLKPDTIVGILRERFDNSFRYDENDAPILWKNEDEIDQSFRLAKEHALQVLNVLCIAKTHDNVEIIPDVDLNDDGIQHHNESQYDENDDDGLYHIQRFSHILNELERENVLKQFRRQINITVIDAKRSIMRTTTHIPVWIYVLLVVLGWNEFMMVIRNPFYVTILLLLSVAFYFIHRYDLWGPVMTVAETAIGETRATVKNKLRDFVLDDHEVKAMEMKEITPTDDSEKDVE